MSEWNEGYTTDVDYLCECYKELNPTWSRLPLLNAGVAFPAVHNACELGLGLGLSANLHAAASTVRWYGNDFSPSQARFAQELAEAAGAGASICDQSFAEFCPREDLPDFDFIGLHGVWSWISNDNRGLIADFIRRKLKVGGVLYISYNTLPGWAAKAPLRHLLTQHGAVMGAPGQGSVRRIDDALEFMDRLAAVKPAYLNINPAAGKAFESLKKQNRAYIAHEYFNRDWHPMYFSDVAEWLAPAKVSYVCSARHLEHISSINLTEEQEQLLNSIPDTSLRETVRDFMHNMQFRQDYWVKGVQKLSPIKQAELLRQERFLLVTPRDEVTLSITGYQCAANLSEALYGAILDALADHKPHTAAHIEQAATAAGFTIAHVLQALMVLTGKGDIVAAQGEDTIAKAMPTAQKLNLHLMEEAVFQFTVRQVASPVSGGGIGLEFFHFLFLLARSKGHLKPKEMARFVFETLLAQGQGIVGEDGKVLDTSEKSMKRLEESAQTFIQKRLPALTALGIT
jgi:SAM-dependent methyltransferase